MILNDLVAIYGLIFDCPVREQRHDCPFAEIRKMPKIIRIQWVRLLTCNEIKNLLEKHKGCFTNNFSFNHKNLNYERE